MNGWDALASIDLPEPGGPIIKGVCDRQPLRLQWRVFDVSLTFHLAEIDVIAPVRGKNPVKSSLVGKKGSFAAEKRECLPQILHAVDVESYRPLRPRARLLPGTNSARLAATPRFQCDRQDAFHGGELCPVPGPARLQS